MVERMARNLKKISVDCGPEMFTNLLKLAQLFNLLAKIKKSPKIVKRRMFKYYFVFGDCQLFILYKL